MYLKTLNERVETAFLSLGLAKDFAALTESNRPDLSDLQCNGAIQAARSLKKPPREIAETIRNYLQIDPAFEKITIDGPGFLNFTISNDYISNAISMQKNLEKNQSGKKIVIDYGGPNVAKPLHVGHLRSAIIGESIKRIGRKIGHDVIADIHLGDWGTPMGMLLAKLERDHPEWVYFQKDFAESSQTKNPPFDVEILNALYPRAARLYKEDESFADEARRATANLQSGHAGYSALWRHFLHLSVQSIKKDFSALDVNFDLWLGESSAHPYIEKMVSSLIERGIAHKSNGAVVIDVAREGDKEKIPPLLLQKRDGAATYATTDLATIFQRVNDFNPDMILYVVDKRQSLHFTQVFRAAAQAGYISEKSLIHLGFGTMNGADGKPFKTRDGGVLRLGELIENSFDLARQQAGYAKDALSEELSQMLRKIAIASIKFGDLSNPPSSDYIFDQDSFAKFEGKTGSYIQYSAVRAKSVLEKIVDLKEASLESCFISHPDERKLALTLLNYDKALESTFSKKAPNILCDYVYELSKNFNVFYRNCAISQEEDQCVKSFRTHLTREFYKTVSESLDLLAIPLPTQMTRVVSITSPGHSPQI